MNPYYDDEVDENYDVSPTASPTASNPRNYHGIAGLEEVDDDAHIVAPTAVMPLLPPIGATGGVARYNVSTTPRPSPGSIDSDDYYDYANLAVLGNMDDIAVAAAAAKARTPAQARSPAAQIVF